MIACSEELDSIALASGFGAAGREQSQPQTSSDEERERVEKDILGLCKHGAPSCCHKCVGKALSSAARAPAHADISRKKMLRAHSHSDEADRAANSSNSAAASSAAARAAIDASSLAPLADAAAGAGASGSQKKPKCKAMSKPKVALRSKLARTNAKVVASLDAYILREEKRLDYWNEKCGQCERILR